VYNAYNVHIYHNIIRREHVSHPLSRRHTLCTVILDVPIRLINGTNRWLYYAHQGRSLSDGPLWSLPAAGDAGPPIGYVRRTRRYFTQPEPTLSDCTPKKIKLISKAKDNNLFTAHPFTCTKILYILGKYYIYYKICAYLYIYIYGRGTREYANTYVWMNERIRVAPL